MSNKELKVKSFRVDEDTFSKFKEIASEEFGNQGQCLDALINLYETEQSKSTLITRQLEIESFQDYINKINRLFVTSLQLSEDAEERAKECFLKKLESKETALITLKEKLELIQDENKDVKEMLKSLTKENRSLKEEVKVCEENKSTLSQLANRNYDLAEEFKEKLKKNQVEFNNLKFDENELKKIKEEKKEMNLHIKELVEKLKNKELDMSSIESSINEKNEEIVSFKDEIKSLKLLLERLKSEREKEKEILEVRYLSKYKNELKERIELLKREHNLEIRELQFKIKTLEK